MLIEQTKQYDTYKYHGLETMVIHENGLEYVILYDEIGESLRRDLTDGKNLYTVLDLYRELSRRYTNNEWETRYETEKLAQLLHELQAK